MGNNKNAKDVMGDQTNAVKNIISKALRIEEKYLYLRTQRDDAIEEIYEVVKNEVKE
jgi:hypothetical protein